MASCHVVVQSVDTMSGSAKLSAMRASQHVLDALGLDESVLATIGYRVLVAEFTATNST